MDLAHIQRNIKRWLTKVQARAEAGLLERWIPVLAFLGLLIFLGRLSLAKYISSDLGENVSRYGQAIYELSKGEVSSPSLFNLDVPVVEIHFSIILYPITLFLKFLEPIQLLLFIQSLFISVTIIPLWLLARNVVKLRLAASSCLLAAFCLHPMTHDLAISDFNPETLAMPFIVGLAYAAKQRNWKLYWFCALIILLVRADLGFFLMLWGFVLLRDGEDKQALRTIAIGSVWAFGIIFILQPLLEADFFTLSRSLLMRDNFNIFVSLLAPLIFLPLLSMRYFFPALPLAAFYLVSQGDLSFGDSRAFLLPAAFIATTFALRRLSKVGVDRVFTDPRILASFLSASALIYISSSVASPYERPWNWRYETSTTESIESAIQLIDDNSKIQASKSALPLLVKEDKLYIADESTSAVSIEVDQIDALLLVEKDFPDLLRSRGLLYSQLEDLDYSLEYEQDGVLLYKRAE